MAAIAGYHLTHSIDRGDAWLNAVDPLEITSTVHKECAWNFEMLNEDLEELKRISFEEATNQSLECGLCMKPLTVKQYYSFQAEYIGSFPESNEG